MVFPDGIRYDFKNDVYRTFRTNSVFDVIHLFTEDKEDKKTGNLHNNLKKSGLVQGNRQISNFIM